MEGNTWPKTIKNNRNFEKKIEKKCLVKKDKPRKISVNKKFWGKSQQGKN